MEPKEIGTVVRIVAGEKNFLNVTWTIIGAGIHGKFDIYFNQQIVQSNIINTMQYFEFRRFKARYYKKIRYV